jgi:hypothetical protein
VFRVPDSKNDVSERHQEWNFGWIYSARAELLFSSHVFVVLLPRCVHPCGLLRASWVAHICVGNTAREGPLIIKGASLNASVYSFFISIIGCFGDWGVVRRRKSDCN